MTDKATAADEIVDGMIDKMLEMFAVQEAWTQYAQARDKDGRDTAYYAHPDAVSFCVLGAAFRVSGAPKIDPNAWNLDNDGWAAHREALTKRLVTTARAGQLVPPLFLNCSPRGQIVAANDSITYDKMIEWLKNAKVHNVAGPQAN